MEIHQIATDLDNPNPQIRMKAITQLRYHSPTVVVPLLRQRMSDPEFIIRSLVATALGNQQTEDSFDALVNLIEDDKDPNVRAEAANSLAKYGESAFPHLLSLFQWDSHWLVRQSILVTVSADFPEILLQFCRWGIEGEDPVVRQTAILKLGELQGTPQAEEALETLLVLATAEAGEIRVQVAKALRNFEKPEAKAALEQLSKDKDYRVVGAYLEGLLSA